MKRPLWFVAGMSSLIAAGCANVADMMAKGRGHKASGEEHGMRKLTKEQVLEIFNDRRPQKQIAAAYGVGLTCVSNIKTGFTWGHVTGKTRAA